MVQVRDYPKIAFMDLSSSSLIQVVCDLITHVFFTGNRHFLDTVMEPQPSLASGKNKNQNFSA